VFDVDYTAIASIVERDEAACRQIMHRARARIADGQPRFDADAARDAALVDSFFAALEAGDVDGLAGVLADDVVFYADGGGRAPAVQHPIHGAVAVARFLAGLVRRGKGMHVRMERTAVNGEPAIRVCTRDGSTLSVLMMHVAGGRVTVVGNQLNPAKLGHLGPVGDLNALVSGGADHDGEPRPGGGEAG